MPVERDRSDQRALLVAGLGGFLLLAMPSAVEVVPWRRGTLTPGVNDELVLAPAESSLVVLLAAVMFLGTLVPGVLALVVLLRTPVIDWPRGRRTAAIAGLALFVGIIRTAVVVLAVPGGVSPLFELAEVALASAEAMVALSLATYYVDTRRRIRAEERERLIEAERAARARAELEEEELRVRREVSQRLHGGLQQRLVVAATELETIQHDLENHGEKSLARSVGELTDTLDTLRENEVRSLAHALYPLAADIDLNAALLLLADQLPPTIKLELTYGPAGRPLLVGGASSVLTATDRVAIFSIVEEGVTNAIRHGHARKIRVVLDVDPGSGGEEQVALVTVDDDGTGLPGDAPTLAGLAGHQARVRRRGGDITLTPSPLGGARLSARLPIRPVRHEVDGLS